MYPTTGQLTLGFHGCDQRVKERVLSRRNRLRASENQWDWLGHGIYFWESDPQRAMEFANSIRSRFPSKINQPSVVGAILDLGNCLNLLSRIHIHLLKRSFSDLKKDLELKGKPLPTNRLSAKNGELLLRDRDCAVINYIHGAMKESGRRQFDSVRAAFWEGKLVYPDAGFRELNHIQICVRNPNCIKGYFDPLSRIRGWPDI